MTLFDRKNSLKPDFAGTPEGMWGPEMALWKRFQALHCAEWSRIWFNVRVGPGEMLTAGAGDAEQNYWKTITQRRIDVLVETDQDIIIVEMRCNADKGTFAAAILYRELWREEYEEDKNLRVLIVTNRMRDDMKKLCWKCKIEVEEIRHVDSDNF